MAATKKGPKRAKSKTVKKSPGRSSKRAPTAFYAGVRAVRGLKRKQFHILLTEEEYAKLAKLTHSRKQQAANVVRDLIMAAKA